MTDRNGKGKWTVAEDAAWFILGDHGLFYADTNEQYHRALFRGRKVLDLPKEASHAAAGVGAGKLSVAFVDEDGCLYMLPDGSDTWTRVGDGAFLYHDFSSDGKTVIWTGEKDGRYTLYLSECGETISLEDIDPEGDILTWFSRDQKLTVIMDRDNGFVWFKEQGKELHSASFEGFLFDTSANGDTGIDELNASQIKEFRQMTFVDDRYDLYRISLDEEKEQLASAAAFCDCSGNTVCSLDEEGTLYLAAMGKDGLGPWEKLTDGVDLDKLLCLYAEGKNLFYVRDDVLYIYRIGAGTPQAILSEAADCTGSHNGRYAVIGKEGGYKEGFDLYWWELGAKAPQYLAPHSWLILAEDSGGVYYQRIYGETFDLVYFNGKKSITIGTNLPWRG